MDHVSTDVPTFTPVSMELGELGDVMTPDPLMTVHTPSPIGGILPVRLVWDSQIILSGPANGCGACASRRIDMVSLVLGQTPLLVVQTRVLVPMLSPVTMLLGLEGIMTLLPPAMTDQTPVPILGVLPPR